MAQFEYRAVDAQGKLVEGTIDAAEVPAVVARLHDRGLIPLNIGEVTAGSRPKARRVSLPTLPTLGGKRVKRRDLLVMTQELTALVSAATFLFGLALVVTRSLLTGARRVRSAGAPSQRTTVCNDRLHQASSVPSATAPRTPDKGAGGSLYSNRAPGTQSRRGTRLTIGPPAEPE